MRQHRRLEYALPRIRPRYYLLKLRLWRRRVLLPRLRHQLQVLQRLSRDPLHAVAAPHTCQLPLQRQALQALR